MARTWDSLEAKVEIPESNFSADVSGDLFYRRWYSHDFSAVAGGSYYSGLDGAKTRAVAGVSYTLPMMIEAMALVDHRGGLRLDLEKHFQWTTDIQSDVKIKLRQNTPSEFTTSLMYAPTWAWATGLLVTEDSQGFGLRYRF